jgi:hypothetical protein
MRQSHDPSSSLPTRFPVGAKYVVEGRGGEDGQLRVFSRYVVLPGGRRIKLPADLSQLPGEKSRRNRAAGRRSQSRKIIARGGTARQQRH